MSAADGSGRLTETLPLGTPAAGPRPEQPPLLIQTHRVETGPALAAVTHRVVEIITRRRAYVLDAQLVCVEVIDLRSGRCDDRHPFLGSRLVGGQSRQNRGSELTFPFPAPGSDAVFQGTDGKGRMQLQITSSVTRVTLHIHHVRVDLAHQQEAWDKLAQTGS